MKNNLLLISTICLGGIVSACKKNGTETPLIPSSSLTFSAGDSLMSFPVNQAAVQDVYSTRTTLITGQYTDTSTRKGSISIRVFGDTTGRYRGDSLLVTYINSSGTAFYNTKDSDNVVTIDKYIKKYNGTVSGSFTVKVANGSESIRLSQGIFTALYQE
ncbi:MAG: hypothetical protein J0H74_06640 [Chitinophagaceae bacterium]|nr:hypothetical protein [Chitinophagaceae bacterium]